MQTWDAITARRNVRAFSADAIPAADLDRILEAGRRSPSSQNWQPWDFVLVTDRTQLRELSQVFRGAYHVAQAAAAMAVVLLAPRSGRPHPAVRIAVIAAAVVVASAVGIAMIGLHYHYFTDTVAGAAVGIGVVIGVAFLLDLPVARRWLRWPGR